MNAATSAHEVLCIFFRPDWCFGQSQKFAKQWRSRRRICGGNGRWYFGAGSTSSDRGPPTTANGDVSISKNNRLKPYWCFQWLVVQCTDLSRTPILDQVIIRCSFLIFSSAEASEVTLASWNIARASAALTVAQWRYRRQGKSNAQPRIRLLKDGIERDRDRCFQLLRSMRSSFSRTDTAISDSRVRSYLLF